MKDQFYLNPPPMAVDPDRFYWSGEKYYRLFLRESPLKGKGERTYAWVAQCIPCKMGMHIPHSNTTEVSAKKAVWKREKTHWRNFLRIYVSNEEEEENYWKGIWCQTISTCLWAYPQQRALHVRSVLSKGNVLYESIRQIVNNPRVTGHHFWARG